MTGAAPLRVAGIADAAYESREWADEGGSLTETGRHRARALAVDEHHHWTCLSCPSTGVAR